MSKIGNGNMKQKVDKENAKIKAENRNRKQKMLKTNCVS